jgi:hypothetical protein
MAGLSDLDFAPGLQIQHVVEERFSSPVSFHTSSSWEFFLVVTFGRSAIRLNEYSVSLILQSCLGGVAKDFKVAHLFGMCFRFLVFSKSVGFLVYNLKFYKCLSLWLSLIFRKMVAPIVSVSIIVGWRNHKPPGPTLVTNLNLLTLMLLSNACLIVASLRFSQGWISPKFLILILLRFVRGVRRNLRPLISGEVLGPLLTCLQSMLQILYRPHRVWGVIVVVSVV